MNRYKAAAELLPPALCSELLIQPEKLRNAAEEIRLRRGQAMSLLVSGEEMPVRESYRVCMADLEAVLERATEASVYASEQELSNGFVSVEGGIRLGVCGTAIVSCGRVSGIRDLSSVSIRIPHEIENCGREALDHILSTGLDSTLILSPPGGGKTTCMREYIRVLSQKGYRVSVADERFELAGVFEGEPQFDVGDRTDIISGAPKSEAAMMLIRAMNPQILAMDEISSDSDIYAAETAAGCGIKLLATAHADSVQALQKRPMYRKLLELGEFKYAVTIRNSLGRREYTTEELRR